MANHEMTITDAEALAGFADALGFGDIVEDPNAQTIDQLGAAFSCSRKTAARRARMAVKAGMLERVTVRRETGNGVRVMEAYRLVHGNA